MKLRSNLSVFLEILFTTSCIILINGMKEVTKWWVRGEAAWIRFLGYLTTLFHLQRLYSAEWEWMIIMNGA
jgi:hypothetical protein